MRVFLTGGSGFLGRALIRRLVAEGHSVRAIARSESSAARVRALGAEPVPGDLDDADALQAGMKGCDAVIHAAAHTEEWGRYEDFHRINVAGTERVLAAARAEGVSRFVHVSSESVLAGGPPIVNADETWPRPARAVGLYPLTKGMAEERVLAANSPELATIVVRPRFIWGKDDTSLLPKLVEAVQNGRFKWIGGGRYLSSTCHVENACEGILLAAEKGRGGEIYFLTDGPPMEFRRFLTDLLATQGVTPGDGSLPHGMAVAIARVSEALWTAFRLPGAPPLTLSLVRVVGEEVTVSDAKARRELGYQGLKTREAGLAELQAK